MSSSIAAFVNKEISLVTLKKNALINAALIYLNSYSVGMSNLGMHTVYNILNSRADTLCERVFFEKKRRQPQSVENRRNLRSFDLLAFSISYELDYLNFFKLMRRIFPEDDLRKRPLMPLVIAGGIVNSVNYQPLSKFCDCIFMGEAEESLPQFMDALSCFENINTKEKKKNFLEKAASINGIFIPGVSDKQKVRSVFIREVDKYPTSSKILTPFTEFSNTFVIEISRGCPWRCNFCVTGAVYRKFRPRSFEVIKKQIDNGLRYTNKIGLMGAAITEHPDIDKIIDYLLRKKALISVSSLRIESAGETLLKALAMSGQKTITFAPEAGSDSLRFSLNKKITNKQILEKINLSKKCGIKKIKLYFMIGLPHETDADIQAIVQLSIDASMILPIKLNVGIFVPKPKTIFAGHVFAGKKRFLAKFKFLRRNFSSSGNIILNLAGIAEAKLEWLFSQADEDFFSNYLENKAL
ncbi:MAG: B12-binding domain-containing radical SAM protein [Candidatus Omnitrophica bacterium]|nr:B12-binding domain-containing radical SAM protein [Candidatus Omnitrophota bacterium]